MSMTTECVFHIPALLLIAIFWIVSLHQVQFTQPH